MSGDGLEGSFNMVLGIVEIFRFNISTFWVPRSIHESKQKQKEKLPLGLGEPAIADA